MIYGYIRTSTDKQNNENQRFEIEQFANNNNLKIDQWIEETISSRKSLDERKLGKLLKKIKQDDIIIATELSRLGRNLLQVMSILHHCMNIGCQVWTLKDNYRLGADIQSKVLAFAFGLSAEIERNLISQRTKEALARKRLEGVRLGRPKGSKTKAESYKLYSKENMIIRLLKKNVSQAAIARFCGVTRNTLKAYIAKRGLMMYVK